MPMHHPAHSHPAFDARAPKPENGRPGRQRDTLPPHPGSGRRSSTNEALNEAMYRFVVLDRHPLMRAGLAAALVGAFGITTETMEAETLRDIDRIIAGGGVPDCLLCDLASIESSGESSLAALVAGNRPVPVIVLTDSASPMQARRVLNAGAAAYLGKDQAAMLLPAVVQLALAGERFLPASLLEATFGDGAGRLPAPSVEDALRPRLTRRQQQVLFLLAQGLSNQMIAERLAIKVGTVKVQLRAIFRAIGVENRTQAALVARGLIPLPAAA